MPTFKQCGPARGATHASTRTSRQVAVLSTPATEKIHAKAKELGNLAKKAKAAQSPIKDDDIIGAIKNATMFAREIQQEAQRTIAGAREFGDLMANAGSLADILIQRKAEELAHDTNEVEKSPNIAVINQSLDDEIHVAMKVVAQVQKLGVTECSRILAQIRSSLQLLFYRKICALSGILEARERLDLVRGATRSLGLGERQTPNSGFSDEKIKESASDLMRLASSLQFVGVPMSPKFYEVAVSVQNKLKM